MCTRAPFVSLSSATRGVGWLRARAGASVRYDKSGMDQDATLYLYDAVGDDGYGDHCPDGWTYKSCIDTNFQYDVTLPEGWLGSGTPEDDMSGTSAFSLQVPVCAPQECFDSLPSIAEDLNDYFDTVSEAIRADAGMNAGNNGVQIGNIQMGSGFCWPRWYNIVFMALGTTLCLVCSACAAKKFIFGKKAPVGSG